MLIEILYFEGCPNHEPTLRSVTEIASALAPAAEIREVRVETVADAKAAGFLGGPVMSIAEQLDAFNPGGGLFQQQPTEQQLIDARLLQ